MTPIVLGSTDPGALRRQGVRMNVSTLVLVLVVAWWLKLMLGLTLVHLLKRRRARPIAPQLIFVPRLDAGCQMVVDARSGRSLDLAFHLDPGRQQMHGHDAFERVGLAS